MVLSCFVFETGSYEEAQARHNFMAIPLPQPTEFWDDRYVPLFPALTLSFVSWL